MIWDRSGIAQCLLRGHLNSVISIALSPTGGLLATGSGDWQAKICKFIKLVVSHQAVLMVCTQGALMGTTSIRSTINLAVFQRTPFVAWEQVALKGTGGKRHVWEVRASYQLPSLPPPHRHVLWWNLQCTPSLLPHSILIFLSSSIETSSQQGPQPSPALRPSPRAA